jgi:pantoate--beta-alanine ligase
VATIFVNPLQFGPGEDFEAYPRTEDADLEAFAGAGVDLVYAPSAADMYPGGAPQVRIAPGPLGEAYEGAIRPGHFAGVATVVAKLLARTRADVAVFGEKDAQQLAVIRRMVADLDMDVVIAAVAIHRDPDGLATSSRNRYLSPRQRADALALPRALDAARAAAGSAAAAPGIRTAASDVLAASPDISVDYLDVVDPADFHPIQADDAGPALVIGAIRVGVARLIDNARVEIAPR